jgi:hypothetical protein
MQRQERLRQQPVSVQVSTGTSLGSVAALPQRDSVSAGVLYSFDVRLRCCRVCCACVQLQPLARTPNSKSCSNALLHQHMAGNHKTSLYLPIS